MIFSKFIEFLNSYSLDLNFSYTFGDIQKLKNVLTNIITAEKNNNGFIITAVSSPKVYIVIISLSLNNFIKVIDKPMIIINGRITVNKFGIKYIDNSKIESVSICNKLEIDINLVNWSNQAIDKKINKISKKPLNNSFNM